MDTIERRSPTEVRVDDKLYAFDTPDQADGFEQCVRKGRASECVADYPPRATSDVATPGAPRRSDAGITIEPPPGVLDDE